MIETVVALLMIVHGEIKEHRIQESMAACLRGNAQQKDNTVKVPSTNASKVKQSSSQT